MTQNEDNAALLMRALTALDPSTRLQAALHAGTHPGTVAAQVLIERCSVEPDFFVRDTLSWALTSYDRESTVDALLAELAAESPQARSQALHTLSKIGDQRAWTPVTGFLADPDLQIAQVAWRAAVRLVGEDQRPWLAGQLATQFGRGDAAVQRSLSRALAALGDAAAPVVAVATTHPRRSVKAHALATERLLSDPDAQFEAALDEANRILALRGAPTPPE